MGRGRVSKRDERIGAQRRNRYGSRMQVIEYVNANDITVRFENGYTTKAVWVCFDQGVLVSPYDKTVFGIGYLGEGVHEARDKEKRCASTAYVKWSSMMHRCYSEKVAERQTTYSGCSVTPEWHNFQNFADWHKDNFYTLEGEAVCLDKDILVRGNQVYSPSTCVYTPIRINAMFIRSTESKKASRLPRGVKFYKRGGNYRTMGNGGVPSRGFPTAMEAFEFYKDQRELYIKQVAEEYRDRIPNRLYEAMLNFEVQPYD